MTNISILKLSLVSLSLASSATIAAPTVTSVIGDLSQGQEITIHGKGFTAKPNAKPLFWWKADEGIEPSHLGRKATWDDTFSGELVSTITAPNASKAVRFDHGASHGAALAPVKFNSNQLFLHRKIYDDFDVMSNVAIRTRCGNVSGQFKPGQVVKGEKSGATGVVESVSIDSGGTLALYFSKTGGTINNTKPVDFIFGEKMTSSTGTAINNEGSKAYPTGTFRTLNYKTVRFWNKAQQNNIYVGAQGANDRFYNAVPENTDSTLWTGSHINQYQQTPKKWQREEVYYKASDIDAKNGIWDFRVNNVQTWADRFITRTSARPDPYDVVYQGQVSNGAQRGTWAYYDSLYIDETWHHVTICSSPTWSECRDQEIQIPTAWSDSRITVSVNEGSLDIRDAVYLYVVDKDGNANSNGFALTNSNPPVAPVLKVAN